MDDSPQKRQSPNVRFALVMGLLIGFSGLISRAIEKALEPVAGAVGAFGMALIAVALLGGYVVWATYWLIRPK